jgi:hypothetical protein
MSIRLRAAERASSLRGKGTNWRHEDRVNWLRLAADIFEVGYKSGGASAEISIVAVRQVAKPKQSLNPGAENVSER